MITKRTNTPNVDALAIPAQFDRTGKANGKADEMAELRAMIEALKAENANLRQSKAKPITMKVSEKGALSIYGMGRFPMTAYASQWQKILGMADQITAFIEANKQSLAWKD